MKAIIVEDSRLARKELVRLLQSIPEVEVVAEAEHPDDAKKLIEKHCPDLLFLDIHMPGKNGFELLDELEIKPKVIFTTAYDQYALRSFDYEAVDYLLKPIEMERLKKAIEKLSTYVATDNQPKLEAQSSVFVKDGDNCWMVKLSDIYLIQTSGNYSQLFFEREKPLIYKTLNQLEQRLPNSSFFRANRQQIVNVDHIKKIEIGVSGNLDLIMHQGITIETSRRHSARFKSFLSF